MLDVHLHGALERLLPDGSIALDVATPAEAVHALTVLIPEFEPALRESAPYYRLTLDDAPITEAELTLKVGARRELHIHPEAAGAADPISGWLIAAVVLSLAVATYAVISIPDIADYGERDAADSRASHLFDGAVNTAAQGGPVPLIYGGPIRVGSTVVSAGISAERVQLYSERPGPGEPGWSEPEGEVIGHGGGGGEPRAPVEGANTLQTRATARVVDLLGEGEMRGLVDGLKSVYVDGVPVEAADGTTNVAGVDFEWRAGLPDQTPLAGIPAIESERPVGAEIKHGAPIVRRITNVQVQAARVTLRFPRLVKTEVKTGDTGPAEVEFRIETRAAGDAWATAVRQTIRDKSTAPAELSWRVPLAGKPPFDVRVTRITADSDSDRLHNKLEWARYTEITEVQQSYPHSALVGITAEAEKFEGRINKREYEVYGLIVSVPANYDAATRRYTGLWDGTFKRAWTDNPAWCAYDLLTSDRYGLGTNIEPESLSATKWSLYQIAQFCDTAVATNDGTEPRYRLTGVINKATEAKRLLDHVFGVCRAAVYHAAGAVVPVQDAPAEPVALIGNASVINGAFSYANMPHGDRVSAVAMSFSDPDDEYKLGVELVVDDALVDAYGYRQADKAAMFCSSRSQAHRLARHVLFAQEHESGTVRFAASLQYADLRPGQVIKIADSNVIGDRFAARLTAEPTKAGRCTLDALPATLSDDDRGDWSVTLTNPDGSLSGPQPITKVVTGAIDTLAFGDDDERPLPGSICVFESTVSARPWRVVSIAERDALEYEVLAHSYLPGKYAQIERDIPAPIPRYTITPGGDLPPPVALVLEETLYVDGVKFASALTISAELPDDARAVDVQWQSWGPEDSGWRAGGITAEPTLELKPVRLGSWRARARMLGVNRALSSPWTEAAAFEVLGKVRKPSKPAGLQTGGLVIHVNPVSDVDLSHYSYHVGAAFESATELAQAKSTEYLWAAVTLGTHTLWVQSHDTSDEINGGSEPASVSIEVTEENLPRTGQDGVGTETIYARTADGSRPSTPSNAWGYDQPRSGWTDGAPGLTAELDTLWRAEREVEGKPAVGDAVAARWSSPVVIGRFGADGQDGEDGKDGADGEDGKDGRGYEHIYARTSGTRPATPNNGWGYDQPRSGWTDGAPTLTLDLHTLWYAARKVDGAPAVGDAVAARWSSPVVIGRFGADGQDGQSVDVIYRISRPKPATPEPSATTPSGWSTDVPTVTDDVWMSIGQSGGDGKYAWGEPVRIQEASSNLLLAQGALPWTAGSGPGGGWAAKSSGGRSANRENVRALREDAFGGQSMVWRASSQVTYPTPTTYPEIGPVSPFIVLPGGGGKSIRVSAFIRSPTMPGQQKGAWTSRRKPYFANDIVTHDGRSWMATRFHWSSARRAPKDDPDAAFWIPLAEIGKVSFGVQTQSAGAALGAPRYFYSAPFPAPDEWYLLVAFLGSGSSELGGVYRVSDGAKVADCTNLSLDNATQVWMFLYLRRWLMGGRHIDIAMPRVDVLDERTPSIDDLLRRGGLDGKGPETIFARTDGATPTAPSNAWGYDQPQNGWTDGAPNLTADLHTLWRSDRQVVGQPAAGTAVEDTWSSPVVVGRFGADGKDGPGTEEIFARTSGPRPPTPSNAWGYDQPQNGWTDGAPTLTADLHTLWRSDRQVVGQPAAGTAVEDTWSSPVVVGRFGADGKDGPGTEEIFARTSGPRPPTPSNAWGYDQPQNGWTDGAPTLTADLHTLWRSDRQVVGQPAAGTAVEDTWSSPVVVGRFGADGKDGPGTEEIFARTSGPRPPTPSNAWGYDQPQNGWTDGAPTLTADLHTLWRSDRQVVGQPAAGTAVEDTWSSPVVVGRFGADGKDGPGTEEIFARTSGPRPPTPSNAWGYDQPQNGWTDGAPTLTADLHTLWRSDRQVVGQPAAGTAVEDTWSSPVVVGRFGADGKDGPGTEEIFARTDGATPTAPSNSWGYDQPRSGWTDGAPTLTADLHTLWRSDRQVVGQPAAGTAVEDTWSSPVVVGRFGADGKDGDPGKTGKPGLTLTAAESAAIFATKPATRDLLVTANGGSLAGPDGAYFRATVDSRGTARIRYNRFAGARPTGAGKFNAATSRVGGVGKSTITYTDRDGTAAGPVVLSAMYLPDDYGDIEGIK